MSQRYGHSESDATYDDLLCAISSFLSQKLSATHTIPFFGPALSEACSDVYRAIDEEEYP